MFDHSNKIEPRRLNKLTERLERVTHVGTSYRWTISLVMSVRSVYAMHPVPAVPTDACRRQDQPMAERPRR